MIMGTGSNSHQQSLLTSLQDFLLIKEWGDFSNPPWRKLSLELQSRAQMRTNKTRGGRRMMLMKRRARLDRRHHNGIIGRKVRILKKLVPNSESMGMEGLFREAADYIVALQMRVKVMQIMVDVLQSGSDGDDDDEE